MKFHMESRSGANLVRAHSPGELRVGENAYRRSVILTASQIIEDWTPRAGAVLTEQDLAPALALAPELIVLGTGPTLQFPRAELRAWVMAQGIGLEVMDTGAACRTYNLLALEGRAVVAALLL